MNFNDKFNTIVEKNNSLLCIGLDPDMEKLPLHLQNDPDSFFAFNKAIIDATHDLVCCYKPNIAFYAAFGEKGLQSLIATTTYLKEHYSDIPILLDAKRGDIGNTAEKYAGEVFDVIGADGVTVNPYMGQDTLEPFLNRRDKGIFVLCRTSNAGAGDFQDLEVDGTPLYMRVAKSVATWNQQFGNCAMVVGATWPEQLAKVRELVPDMPLLIPGIGSQGGDLEKTLQNGLTQDKKGLLISVSRGILYASSGEDFAQKAREKAAEIQDTINNYRQ